MLPPIKVRLHAQVLNDLLDPSSTNLKLRESPSKGFFVEGIKEETLVSAEHALSVIAAGDANRKVRLTQELLLLCKLRSPIPHIADFHALS